MRRWRSSRSRPITSAGYRSIIAPSRPLADDACGDRFRSIDWETGKSVSIELPRCDRDESRVVPDGRESRTSRTSTTHAHLHRQRLNRKVASA